jgi:hypothetical protein
MTLSKNEFYSAEFKGIELEHNAMIKEIQCNWVKSGLSQMKT